MFYPPPYIPELSLEVCDLRGATVKTFITFGQIHVHQVNGITLDRNIVAVIDRPTEREARERAHELFGDKWAFSYPEDKWTEDNARYFPRGTVEIE